MPNLYKEQNAMQKNGVYRLKLMKLKSQITNEAVFSRALNRSPVESKGKMGCPIIEKKKSFKTLFVDANPFRNKSPLKVYNPLIESKNENLSTFADESSSNVKATSKSIESENDTSVLPGIKASKLYDKDTQAYIEALVEEIYKKRKSGSFCEPKRSNSIIEVRNEQIAQPVCNKEAASPIVHHKSRSLSKPQNIPKLQDFYLLRENQKLNSYRPLVKGFTSKDQKDPMHKLIRYNEATRIQLLAPVNRDKRPVRKGYKRMTNSEIQSIIEKEGNLSQVSLIEKIQQLILEKNKICQNKNPLNGNRKVGNKSDLLKEIPRPLLEIDCVGGKSQRNNSTRIFTEETEKNENKKEDVKSNTDDSSKQETIKEEEKTEEIKPASISPPRRVLISYKDKKEILHMNNNINNKMYYKMNIDVHFENKDKGVENILNNSDESTEPFILGNNKLTSVIQELI